MNILNTLKHRIRVNLAVREISGLNDNILWDIGINRANIRSTVEKHMSDDAGQDQSWNSMLVNRESTSIGEYAPDQYLATRPAAA